MAEERLEALIRSTAKLDANVGTAVTIRQDEKCRVLEVSARLSSNMRPCSHDRGVQAMLTQDDEALLAENFSSVNEKSASMQAASSILVACARVRDDDPRRAIRIERLFDAWQSP